MRAPRALSTLYALALAAPAAAQSFNIDFGPPGAGPPADYRAAGVRGFWNSFETIDSTVYQLVDVDGILTGVTLSQFGGTEIVQGTLAGPGDPQGGHRTLLEDAMVTHTTIESCLFIHNLLPGTYEVTTYAWMPTAPATLNNVHVDNNPTSHLVGAPWSGAHAPLATFARHIVQDAGGFIGPHSGVPLDGDYVTGAALNGIQIRRLDAVPPLFASASELEWLAALEAPRYDVVRGDLSLLRATAGDFSVAASACLAENSPLQQLDHAVGAPPPGEAWWYVVRGVGAGGPMTYDTLQGSQVGSRDAELDASPVSCN
jgi:hypothetical protein